MKTFIYLILIFSVPSFLFAQTQITLLEAGTSNPITGAVVKIPGSENKVSDNSGTVAINTATSLRVSLSHIGYEPKSIVLVPGEQMTVYLNPAVSNLTEVVVTGFESERPLVHQAGAISKVLENELYRFNENSLLSAFNTKAGVRVEQRALASYRISIRGSSLRSPFGVRNIKVYWNDIPFTSPDGTTALNLLDLANLQDTEIIKGPAGSIYGAGNGGVINMTSKKEITENYLSADLGIGDFGLRRYRIGIDQKIGTGSISASYVHQQADGYREHNALDRKVFQMALNTKPSDRQNLSLQLLYSDLNYQIPGALTLAQLEADRRQARPGSVGQNSSIAQKSLWGTVSHQIELSDKLSNSTALYLTTTDFENPFILDYKKETAFSYGGRTKFTFSDRWGNFPIKLVAGAEYQIGKTLAQNFGNRNGRADTIRFSDDLVSTQAFIFQQLEVEWTDKLLMTIGFSENFGRYDIRREIDAGPNNPSDNTKKFDPIVVPRLAMVYRLNPQAGIHASISSGFSPPTIAEVRTNEGSINLDLQAERGVNYEAGYRSRLWIFNVDLTAYYFKLDQTITTFTNPQGVVLFRNAGQTDQKGVEFSFDYAPYRNQASLIQEVKLGHAYTGQFYKFANYTIAENNYSGNDLTGVAPHALVNMLDIRSRLGFYLNLTHHYVDSIPLNDANTVFQSSYNLIGSRIGWRSTFGGKWDVEAYAGADNLLDEVYSLGNDLNAMFNRYYQPAPGRNFYGGFKIGMRY